MVTSTRALALLARIIGRQHGLEVVFSDRAQTASTDGKRITLPLLANVGSEDHSALTWGLVDHESAHCRFTDFSVELGKLPQLVAALTNVLEDVRIERMLALSYPGCALNIRKALRVMMTLGWFRGPDPTKPTSLANAFVNFILLDLRSRANEVEEFKVFAQGFRDLLEPVIGFEMFDRIQMTSHKVYWAQSTKDACAIAHEIADLLREAAQQLAEQQQPQQGDQGQKSEGDGQSGAHQDQQQGQDDQSGPPQGSGSPQAGTGSSEDTDGDPEQSGDPGQADGSPQATGGPEDGESEEGQGGPDQSGSPQQSDGAPGAGKSEDDQGDPDQSGGPDTSGGASQGNGNSQPQAGQPGAGDGDEQADAAAPQDPRIKGIEDILNACGDDLITGELADSILDALKGENKAGADLDEEVASHAMTLSKDRYSRRPFEALAPVNFEDLNAFFQAHQLAAVDMSRGIGIKLGNKLEELLEARTDTFEVRKRSGHRVVNRRVSQVPLGKLDVFRSVEEEDSPDTVVLMMLDDSGSMFFTFDGRAHVDMQPNGASSPVTADEIRRLSAVKPEQTRAVCANAVAYAAAQALDKHDIPFSLVAFGDGLMPIKSFDERWGSCRSRRGMLRDLGGTQTDCALLGLIEPMALREESRKLVVLVSDGCPNDEESLIAVMSEARLYGVEFAMLFIGDEGQVLEMKLMELGHQVARAKSADALASSFFDAVKAAI